jgi:autophagy-related protein 18
MMRSWTTRRAAGCRQASVGGPVGGYPPNTLTEMWEPSRDFAFLKLPTSGARCIVALSACVAGLALCYFVQCTARVTFVNAKTMSQIMVVSSEGYLYSYSIDL